MASVVEALQIAVAHHQHGNGDEAARIYGLVLDADPNQPDALYLLGILHRSRRQTARAIELLDRAIAVAPERAIVHQAKGNALRDQDRLVDAIASLRRAVELDGALAPAVDGLATCLFALGRLPEAETAYRRLIALEPGNALAHHSLGVVLKRLNRPAEAVESYQRALGLDPANPMTWYYQALALSMLDRHDEALASLHRAVALKPDLADAHIHMAGHLQDARRLDEARQCYERAIEIGPESSDVHSNLMLCVQYLPDAGLEWLHQVHRSWSRRHEQPLQAAWRPHANSRDPERRLRLGFVSADIGRHPVGYFLARVLRHLDPTQVETVVYCDRVGPKDTVRRVPDPAPRDSMTNLIQSLAGAWRDSVIHSPEELAGKIREDRIDILFDMAGHTANNRLMTFARKPAPLQVTWAGYVGTTGLDAMDYLIADRFHVPPEHDRFMQERVLRLPDGYICYDPPDYAPPVGPLPASTSGRVTFGAFNNPTKIMPQTVAVWAEILRRVPDSRLVMRYRGLEKPTGLSAWIRNAFVEQGIAAERVELLGPVPHPLLLDCYNEVDIALDSFPYSGGLTTCEALWMGAPVVTRPGETFASRHSFSHLSNCGLTDTIARTLDGYVEIAVRLTQDLPRLAEMRASLRPMMAASALCDGERFARNFQAAMRGIWREWCGRA